MRLAEPRLQGVTAAKNATKTIPIVMIGVRDPVGTGLIAPISLRLSPSLSLELAARLDRSAHRTERRRLPPRQLR
jgi:hypothetical protein